MSVSTRSVASSKTCGCRGKLRLARSPTVRTTAISHDSFFRRALLTDEDLQATLDYFVTKNRLHNRHFFGEGVVCGLEVVSHPCPDSQRKVVVAPRSCAGLPWQRPACALRSRRRRAQPRA